MPAERQDESECACRPTSVTVFGMLNIVFGSFGVFRTVVSFGVILFRAWTFAEAGDGFGGMFAMTSAAGLLLLVLNLFGSSMELSSGIGLLRMRTWARLLAIAYALFAWVAIAIGAVITYISILGPMAVRLNNPASNNSLPEFMVIGAVISLCVSGIYPTLLLYFMTRRNVVLALRGQASPPMEPEFLLSAAATSRNPYASPGLRSEAPVVGGASGAESVVEAFIPTKNGPALASYYLGLFSLFPILGFFLAVAAVFYGIKGLRRVRENPAVRGGAHAWVGLICGALFGLFNFALLVLLLIGIGSAIMRR